MSCCIFSYVDFLFIADKTIYVIVTLGEARARKANVNKFIVRHAASQPVSADVRKCDKIPFRSPVLVLSSSQIGLRYFQPRLFSTNTQCRSWLDTQSEHSSRD